MSQLTLNIKCQPISLTSKNTAFTQTVFVGTQATSTVKVLDFTATPNCPSLPPLTYSVSVSPGGSLPSCITYDPSANTFTVQSGSIFVPITYSITLKAVMGSLQSSFTWTLTAVDSPAVSTAGFSGGGNSAFKSAINLPTLSYKLAANNSLVITSNDFSKYNISSYNYI